MQEVGCFSPAADCVSFAALRPGKCACGGLWDFVRGGRQFEKAVVTKVIFANDWPSGWRSMLMARFTFLRGWHETAILLRR